MKKLSVLFLFLVGILFFSCNQKNKESENIKKVVLNKETIAVGIYKAENIEYKDVNYISEATKIDAGIVYVTLTDSNLIKTRLDNINVLVLPQLKNDKDIDKIDPEIAEIIKEFVAHKGKKVITFGNGGLLLAKNEGTASLELVNIKLERDSTNSLTKGIVACRLTNHGEEVFPEMVDYETFFMCYNVELLIEIADTNSIQVLVEGIEDGAGFSLMVSAEIGKGKVLMINASPETTPGMRWIIPRVIRWIDHKDFVWYAENIFKPKRYNQPVMLDPSLNEQLDKLLMQLDLGNKDEIMTAMNKLQEIYPWVGAEKVRSLLVAKNDDIKLRAAEYLVDIEYTLALEDFEQVIQHERRRKVKEQLSAYKEQLEKMLEQN